MRLRIRQARPVDSNDAIRHFIELQAFQSSWMKMQETRGFVRAVEKDPPNVRSTQTDQLLKNIAETLTSLQLDVKALKEKQSRELSWRKSGHDLKGNQKETTINSNVISVVRQVIQRVGVDTFCLNIMPKDHRQQKKA